MVLAAEGVVTDIMIHARHRDGDDETGDGSKEKPYKSRRRAMKDVPLMIPPGHCYRLIEDEGATIAALLEAGVIPTSPPLFQLGGLRLLPPGRLAKKRTKKDTNQ